MPVTLAEISIREARRIWLRAQRLDIREPFGEGPDATRRATEHLGYVQIDTINVIERSHHHILFTRIPAYRRRDLSLSQSRDKSVFEYWTHALSYVPTRDLRFFLRAMRDHTLAPKQWYTEATPKELSRLKVLAGRDSVCSYDPQTGEPLWTCRWSADRVENSVAFDDQHVYASARQPNSELLCIRADGTGDVTNTHVVWRSNKSASEIPSPVVYEGRLYSTTDEGVLSCLDTTNGQPLWKRRLGGAISSSPVIAGQHLYCCNEDGTIFVIRLGARGELVSEIPLGEAVLTSPIFSHNRLYLRTLAGIHCVTSSERSPLAVQPEAPRRKL